MVASMKFLLPVTAALTAILILPGASFYFDVAPKATVVLIAAAFAVNLLKWERFSFLLAASAVAAILATHSWRSIYGSTWRRDGLIVEIAIFVLVSGIGEPRNLLRAVTWVSIPVAIYAILQYFGIDPLLAPAGYHFGAGEFTIVRPPSTLGHAGYLATFLLFAVFAAAAEKSRWGFLPMALCIFAIVLSGTRAALLGLVVGAVLVATRRAVVIAVAAIAVFYFSPPGAMLRARVHWAREDSLGGARLLLWRDTLRMASHRPILGYGPETFSREFLKSESLELERAYPDFYHESPHNIFLDALVSKGLLGLIPLVCIVAFALIRARGPTGAAFVAMLVSLQFTTFTIPTELCFYLCARLLLRDAAPVVHWKFWPLGIPFLAFAVYLTTGDALLASARRAIDHGDASKAIVQIDRARKWGASADVYFSRRLAGERNFPAWLSALHCASLAPQTADDPQNALLNLAALQAVANDAPGVERTLREAIHAAPNWYKPHWLLAQVLEREGRNEEARVEAQAAIDRDGGKHPEVRATLDGLLIAH